MTCLLQSIFYLPKWSSLFFSVSWSVSSYNVSMHRHGVANNWYACSSREMTSNVCCCGMRYGMSGNDVMLMGILGHVTGACTLGDGAVGEVWFGTLSVVCSTPSSGACCGANFRKLPLPLWLPAFILILFAWTVLLELGGGARGRGRLLIWSLQRSMTNCPYRCWNRDCRISFPCALAWWTKMYSCHLTQLWRGVQEAYVGILCQHVHWSHGILCVGVWKCYPHGTPCTYLTICSWHMYALHQYSFLIVTKRWQPHMICIGACWLLQQDDNPIWYARPNALSVFTKWRWCVLHQCWWPTIRLGPVCQNCVPFGVGNRGQPPGMCGMTAPPACLPKKHGHNSRYILAMLTVSTAFWAPVNMKLTLFESVFSPIKAHIHSSCVFF
jgi:hypothetical protein